MVTPSKQIKNSSIPSHHSRKMIAVVLAGAVFAVLPSCAQPEKNKFIQEAKKAIDNADPAMGCWQGSWRLNDETESGPLVAQVIAWGQQKYQVNLLEQFDRPIHPIAVLQGQRKNTAIHFAGPGYYEGYGGRQLQIKAAIENRKFTGTFQARNPQGQDAGRFVLEKVYRLSPTLAARPPAGAIVLFDGKNFKQWKHARKKSPSDKVRWKLVDGAMEVKPGTGSIITKKQFSDIKLHLEFRTPFMPDARGQGRGNSGVYLQARYEVQILDSFGLQGKDNQCGGIYKVARPSVNMCAPPLQWQTYDITFRAPRLDKAGNKIKNASLTVLHNGVKIHENVELPKPTAAALYNHEAPAGPVYLQDHGNPVQYRNIWVVELPPER